MFRFGISFEAWQVKTPPNSLRKQQQMASSAWALATLKEDPGGPGSGSWFSLAVEVIWEVN